MEKTNNRVHLTEFVESGLISKDRMNEAMEVADIHPDGRAWFHFLDRLLMTLGGLAIAFSLLFFIAYNWQEMGRIGKFAIVESFIFLCALVFLKTGLRTFTSKVVLLVTSISVGVLLALFGQTYQTGADTWQLFFNWALLIFPFVLVSRFPAHWLLWLTLLNLSTWLYFETFGRFFWIFQREQELNWWLFTMNLFAWIAVEAFVEWGDDRFKWLKEQWFIRCIALAVGVSISWLAIHSIIGSNSAIGVFVWLAWAIATVYTYQTVRRDLFILAGVCFSSICVMVAFMIEFLFDYTDAGSFLIFTLSILGMGSGSAIWLRQVHNSWIHEYASNSDPLSKDTQKSLHNVDPQDIRKDVSQQEKDNDNG